MNEDNCDIEWRDERNKKWGWEKWYWECPALCVPDDAKTSWVGFWVPQ